MDRAFTPSDSYCRRAVSAHSTASRTPVKGRRSRAPLKSDFGIGCAASIIHHRDHLIELHWDLHLKLVPGSTFINRN